MYASHLLRLSCDRVVVTKHPGRDKSSATTHLDLNIVPRRFINNAKKAVRGGPGRQADSPECAVDSDSEVALMCDLTDSSMGELMPVVGLLHECHPLGALVPTRTFQPVYKRAPGALSTTSCIHKPHLAWSEKATCI